MCVNLGLYPCVNLTDGKKKVLFDFGVVIENRDFTSLNSEAIDWKRAVIGLSPSYSKMSAVKKYGIKSFDRFVNVPCGKCEQCLKSKARGWAFRILKEAEKYDNNYFVTLTYSDENLKYAPLSYKNNIAIATLVKDEISRFNKKLKTYLSRKGLKSDFRFYAVGEYGSVSNRPHYHVIYFNLDLPDDLKFYKYENGSIYYTSDFMTNTWSLGHVVIGSLDIGSACYVARYCDKKLNRSKSEKEIFNNFDIIPEFSVMSRHPGIGADFLNKCIENVKNGVYRLSTHSNDFSIPIYYSKKIKEALADTVYLQDYETVNNNLIKNKINRDLLLSDILQTTDLQDYYLQEDKFKKSCKKLRDKL